MVSVIPLSVSVCSRLYFRCRLHRVFNFLRQVCVCASVSVMGFASGAAHAGMCNMGQLSQNMHTLSNGISCHTVPHGAMLFLSHAAPEQMVDRRQGEDHCGHGWRTTRSFDCH